MAEKLKDQFFTPESLAALSDAVTAVYSAFPREKFLSLVQDENWESLELKARMRHTSLCLGKVLPASYPEAVEILCQAAPQVKGFEAMCLPDYVELHGLSDWGISLPALECFTRYSSSEFAIRPFLVADLARAMAFLDRLAESEHENVRRFASEGCRPRLPWAAGVPELKRDPSPIVPILEKLKDDPSEFVRRSVSNNLNDIAKDHVDLVLDLCQGWKGQSPEVDWVVKRGCRSLLKAGNPRALRLFGFGDPADIQVEALTCASEVVTIGEKTALSFEVVVGTEEPCDIRLEYAIYFVKKTGKRSRKVFQISEREWSSGRHTVQRHHSFADLSTRKHYPGPHLLEVIVNGVVKASQEIHVKRESSC